MKAVWYYFFVKKAYVVIAVLSLLVGLGLGLFFHTHNLCFVTYAFVNPRLGCDERPVISKASYIVFEDKLDSYLEEEKKAGVLSDYGVYFRDLESGPYFGVNEDELFVSASLVKLPVAMAFMRFAEDDPSLLGRRVLYTEQKPDEQNIAPNKTLVVGQSYTLEDLLSRSLVYSDNTANELLVTELSRIYPDKDLFTQTFRDLGLVLPDSAVSTDLSTRSYASLLRVLYNASYLSQKSSNKLLELLCKSTFKQGLGGGVPGGIKVANKFGEREIEYLYPDKTTYVVQQLHDCGIIYFPKNPYLLCVMTRGSQISQLTAVIAHVSGMVYAEVTGRVQ